MQWTTGITDVQPNSIRIRGYAIGDMIRGMSFGEAIYLVLRGERPSAAHARLLNAVLVASIDHSVAAPSTCATRFVASGGSPMQAAVAAGLSAIGDHHGGAIMQAQVLLQEGVARAASENRSLTDEARTLLTEYKAQKRRVPGLGHPYHNEDPRSTALFTLAREEDMAGPHVELAQALGAESADVVGRALAINTDMAQAAILAELGFDPTFARGVFLISRCPGLVAHASEEYTRERPFRAIDITDVVYDGPPARTFD